MKYWFLVAKIGLDGDSNDKLARFHALPAEEKLPENISVIGVISSERLPENGTLTIKEKYYLKEKVTKVPLDYFVTHNIAQDFIK